jgi:hypothetical protein
LCARVGRRSLLHVILLLMLVLLSYTVAPEIMLRLLRMKVGSENADLRLVKLLLVLLVLLGVRRRTGSARSPDCSSAAHVLEDCHGGLHLRGGSRVLLLRLELRMQRRRGRNADALHLRREGCKMRRLLLLLHGGE